MCSTRLQIWSFHVGISHKEFQNEKHTERAEITGVAHSCCRLSLTTLAALEITVQRERKLHLMQIFAELEDSRKWGTCRFESLLTTVRNKT